MADPGGDTPMWRTFVAIELPDDVRRTLSGLRTQAPEDQARCVRWVRPEAMHLTLRFLGDVDPEIVPAITAQLADAARKSGRFTLALGAGGAFPSLRQPRVLWVGLTGEIQRLRLLHSRVEGALSQAGFAPEKRSFGPHLTVGRIIQADGPRLARWAGVAFGRVRLPEPPPAISVESIVLFRSHLKPSGAEYERLFEARLP